MHPDLVAELADTSALRTEQIDVFADRPLGGNPAAVVIGGAELATETMQAIARETNLSETVFLLPPARPAATWRARIFTTRREIPFAGHPALAAADCVRRLVDRILGTGAGHYDFVQDCGAGAIGIRFRRDDRGGLYGVALPTPRHETVDWSADFAAGLLGLDASLIAPGPITAVATGAPWALVELTRPDALAEIRPDTTAMIAASRAAGVAGVTPFAIDADGVVHLRTFAPAEGIPEDPGCGSCMGSITAHFAATGRLGAPAPDGTVTIRFAQGDAIGRPGRAQVVTRATPGPAYLEGRCSLVLTGRLHIAP